MSCYGLLRWPALFMFVLQAHGQITISPQAPREAQTVRVQMPASALLELYNGQGTTMSMEGSRITITLGGTDFLPLPSTQPLDWPVGQLPPGTYQVEVRQQDNREQMRTIGTTQFTVAPRTAQGSLWNHSDMWWNPSESGWGVSIVQHGTGAIFAVFFLYDQDREPAWYVVPGGQWIQPTQFTGAVYRTAGPAFGATFNPADVTVTSVGTATFEFSGNDPDRATLNLAIEGRTIQKAIHRQAF